MIILLSFVLPALAASVPCPERLEPLHVRYKFERALGADRSLVVEEFGLAFKPGERNRDLIRRIDYRLVDSSSRRIVWSFEDLPNNLPTAVVLDPGDPDVVYVAKKVERLSLAEERLPQAKPSRAYPGLASRIVYEVVKVGAGKARPGWVEIHDAVETITDLRIETDSLVVVCRASEIRIPLR